MRNEIVGGYRMLYLPFHNSSYTTGNWKGWIYEHRKIAEDVLQRPLTKNEIVHHIDGNKLNNDRTNIQVMSRSEHTKHHYENRNELFKINEAKSVEFKKCNACGKDTKNKKFCSISCRNKNRPSIVELNKLKMTYTNKAIGVLFNVSEAAVRKWIKEGNHV